MEKSRWKRLLVATTISLTVCFQASVSFAAYKLGEVTTLSGTGELGYEDGASSTAKYHFPSVAVEASDGSIYVSDTLNHRIRVITPEKQVKTFTGTTSAKDEYGFLVGGYKDGNKTSAMFNEPKGLAITNSGTLYVADSGNSAIRAIDKNGNVTTVTKDVNSPSDIVVGQNGELVISDTLNHRIIKMTEKGEISVLAGGGYSKDGDWLVGGYADGNGTSAKFNEPTGLAIDSDGNVYVADTGNQRIRKIDGAGNVTTIAGTGASKITDTSYITGGFVNGNAASAQFNFPSGLAFDQDGNLFVADTLNHAVRVITPSGNVETVAGVVGESGNKIGSESKAQFDRPVDITVSKSGSLLIIDQANNKVRELSWFKLPSQLQAESSSIRVVFANQAINFSDAAPKVVNGRTLIPLRAVTETFGYEVDWNGETQEIKIENGDETLVLKVGDLHVTKGDNQILLDVAPEVEKESSRTYVPLRFVAEAFNYQVDWLNKEQVVVIR